VLGIPELGCDENVLTLEVGDLAAESLLQGLSNLLLVAVDLCEIKVTVASLESLEDGSADLTWLSLPCAETKLAAKISNRCVQVGCLFGYSRNGSASVESNLPSERHDCNWCNWVARRKKAKSLELSEMRMFWAFKRGLGKSCRRWDGGVRRH
jgi:hypothetical protein